MRALHTITGEFVEIDPGDPNTKYAILSHTWDSNGEQTYQALREIQNRYAQKHHESDVSAPSAGCHELGSPYFPSPSGPLDASSLSAPSSTFSALEPSCTVTPEPVSPTRSDTLSRQECTLLGPVFSDRDLSSKVREACRIAREAGYEYIWIDSCCIDKMSSSELSESINSMYQWYALADVCYAFLASVPEEDDHEAKDSSFRQCRWFTRGWTLQELIAPTDLVFLSKTWTSMGTKRSLATLVAEITNVSGAALLHIEPLEEFSVAQRLSWASTRKTTRVEDRADSLLGIFDINMPTLYGEGNRAFRRLQEEIMRRIPDQSLFAWTSYSFQEPPFQDQGSGEWQTTIQDHDHASLLASSLDDFRECSNVEAVYPDEVVRRLQQYHANLELPAANYEVTPYGTRTQLLMISLSDYLRLHPRVQMYGYQEINFPPGRLDWLRPEASNNWQRHSLSRYYVAIIGCEHKHFPGRLLGRICYVHPFSASVKSDIDFLFCGRIVVERPIGRRVSTESWTLDILPLSSTALARLNSYEIEYETIYLPHPSRDVAGVFERDRRKPHETVDLILPRKTRDALYAEGYKTDVQRLEGVNSHSMTIHVVTLSHLRDTHAVVIEFQHALAGQDQDQVMKFILRAYAQNAFRAPADDNEKRSYIGPQIAEQADGTVSLPWRRDVCDRQMLLDLGGDKLPLMMRLRLTFATRNHYFLHIDLETRTHRRKGGEGSVSPEDARADSNLLMALSALAVFFTILVGIPLSGVFPSLRRCIPVIGLFCAS